MLKTIVGHFQYPSVTSSVRMPIITTNLKCELANRQLPDSFDYSWRYSYGIFGLFVYWRYYNNSSDTYIRKTKKIQRNEDCPCGSKIKVKKCCPKYLNQI